MYPIHNLPQFQRVNPDQTKAKTKLPESITVEKLSDPNLTTSRLVGNGLAYFVFWFVGAPIFIFVVFVSFLMSGILRDAPVLFLLFLLFFFGAFIYHTVQITYSGLSASVASNDPVPKASLISTAQPKSDEERIPCPMCAEKILPQAKICHFCKSVLNPSESD